MSSLFPGIPALDVDSQSRVIYLDTAGKSPLPFQVEQAGVEAVKRKTTPWNGLDTTSRDVVRNLFGTLINSSPENIAIATSTSAAMSLIAFNLSHSLQRLSHRNKIVICENEMSSAVYPWQYACKVSGATLDIVQRPADISRWMEVLLSHIDETVAVVAVPCVHWCDGLLTDFNAINHRLDELMATGKAMIRPMLIIDGTQSIGIQPFDVSIIKPSFVACSVHKWLLGPYGMSLVYVAPELHLSLQPIDHHERSREGSDSSEHWDEVGVMNNLTGYPTEYLAGARRLDCGGRPNPIILPMVATALQVVHSLQPGLLQHVQLLTDLVQYEIYKRPWLHLWVESLPRKSRCRHIIGVTFTQRWKDMLPQISISEIGQSMNNSGVKVSVRYGNIRISPYIFNTASDIDRCVSVLQDCMLRSAYYSSSNPASPGSPVSPLYPIYGRQLRVLFTGASGWLGQFLYRDYLSTLMGYSITVYGCYHDDCPEWIPPPVRLQLDLTSPEQIRDVISSIQPDIFIHLAAMTAPALCAKFPTKAEAVNCPTSLVEAIEEFCPNCLFIFTSTDLVYDGEKSSPYATSEDRCPVPGTKYGQTKRAFEAKVLQLQNGVVLRLSNMIGPDFAYRPNGNGKFLQFLRESFAIKKSIGLRFDEIRSFVSVHDVVNVISRFIEFQSSRSTNTIIISQTEQQQLQLNGVFNVGGPQGLSRLDLGRIVAESSGGSLIVASTGASDVVVNKSDWMVTLCSNEESIQATGILNPRDVTMDSTPTEVVLDMKFIKMADLIPWLLTTTCTAVVPLPNLV